MPTRTEELILSPMGMQTLYHTVAGGSKIKKVIFNDPATIVFWGDGTKTVVKCQEGDTFDKELGLAMAICKKHFGNKGRYNNEFKKWVYEDD